MSNLFNINASLQAIYNEIEDNDGELTPELEEQLIITEESFKSKLNDYCNLVKSLKSEVELCAVEAKRIAEYKKRKEKLIEKLNEVIADAVCKFGNTTKSGGANMDLGTQKIVVRNTTKVEVNENVIEEFSEHMNKFIHNVNENNLIGVTDLSEDFLNGDENQSFSKDDLENINFDITFKGNVLELIDGDKTELLKAMYNLTNGIISYNASKTNCKNAISDGKFLSFANIVPNKSVTIK